MGRATRTGARALVGLVRPFTLLAPAVGALAGAWTASSATGRVIDATAAAFGVAAALAATAASNAWNQAFDVELDRIDKPGRPVPRGDVTPRAALGIGHVCAALAVACAALATRPFLVCVVLGLLATWVYSAPPLRTKRHPFASLASIAVARGFLVPLAGWSLVADPSASSDPWVLGGIAALFVFGAAATKDFADVAGDRTHGCRTLPVIWGPERSARVIAPFLWAPFLLYPLAGVPGLLHAGAVPLAVLAAVLAGGGLLVARLLLRDPAALARGGTHHPAWRGMYLLMIGAHVGVALAYAFSAA